MERAPDRIRPPVFQGFPAYRANVTYVPIQFFTVVLPNCYRGTVRIVGYVLRKILGWVDETGQPTQEQLQFTYRELIEKAGVSRPAIAEALEEALRLRFLRCVRAPTSDMEGKPGCSGVYELCWNWDGPYTNKLAEFQGFHYAAAAVLEEGEGAAVVRRPGAARKNIPNAFFDILLPRERLSVIRVVGAILFYSIKWGPGGERRAPVELSITELSKLTRMSRHHAYEAVLEAMRRGYIEPVDAGRFDPAAGRKSRAATYGIRWLKVQGAATPSPNSNMPAGTVLRGSPDRARGAGERLKRVNGRRFNKVNGRRLIKVNGKRLNMVNGINIKTESKTDLTAAAGGSPPGASKPARTEPAAAAADLLVSQGFDETTAGQLAQRVPLDVIQRQIDWLPGRSATRNRLGLLRRAIEHNWPQPEGAGPVSAVSSAEQAQARLFASHYYGAYHGLNEPAQTEPFPKDLQAAGQFVARLLELKGEVTRVPEWGRQFGRLMRDKHHGDPKAKPNLSFALTLFGAQFLAQWQREAATRRRKALGTARDQHQAAFYARYEDYIRQREIALPQADAALYAAFLENRRETRHQMSGGLLLASADTLAKFDSERSRLHCFADFFHRHPQQPVLDFWAWDARFNPQRFGSGNPNRPAGSEEAHP